MSPTPAITSGPMIRTVVARRGWPHGADRVPRRWGGWARERANRGTRWDRAHRTAPMSVLGRPQVVHGPGPLWQTFSHSAALNLAVHPVVRWRAGGQRARVASDRQTAGQLVALYRRTAPPPAPAIARVAALAQRVPGHGRRMEGGALREWRVAARPPRERNGPLRGSGPAADVGTGRAPGGGAHAVRRLVDNLVIRVVRGHRRVEVPARRPVVIRDRASVVVEAQRALTAVDRRAGWQDGAAPSATRLPAGQAAAMRTPMDLDRLTDQIVTRLDDRLTAHRERLGRAF